MNAKFDREYGIRHLKPSNLSQLKKDLTKQLTALRPASSVNSAALKWFGNVNPSSSPSLLSK